MTKANYLFLDAARIGDNLFTAIGLNKDYRCVYNRYQEHIFQKIGPYIFLLDGKPSFQQWYFETGWGESWGFLVHSETTLDRLKDHFQRYKMIADGSGTKKYFRYYDPRVLKQYLPACSKMELEDFFGPAEYFILEDAARTDAVKVWLLNGRLCTDCIALSSVTNLLNFPNLTR